MWGAASGRGPCGCRGSAARRRSSEAGRSSCPARPAGYRWPGPGRPPTPGPWRRPAGRPGAVWGFPGAAARGPFGYAVRALTRLSGSEYLTKSTILLSLAAVAAPALPQVVTAVRRFNRFYTKQIGLLHEHLLRSPFSLTAARVLYELAHRATTTATDLGGELGLDAGYLSRVLRRFQIRGLLDRKPSQSDGRQSVLSLTPPGGQAF